MYLRNISLIPVNNLSITLHMWFTDRLRIQAIFKDGWTGQRANAELLMLSHFSANDQHIKVVTSTITPRVSIFLGLIYCI